MSRGSLPPLEDDFSRALLGSAEADAPSSAAYTKAAAALGIGVGLGIGASIPAPAAVAVGAASVAGAARWSSSLGAKLLAFGASGVLLVGAGALLLRPATPTEPAQASGPAVAKRGASGSARVASPSRSGERAVSVSPSASPSASPSVPRAGVPAAAIAAQPAAAVSRPLSAAPPARRAAHASAAHAAPAHASPAHASPAHAAPASASTGSSLAEQVQSLDRARVALASGDSSSALREIARYRAAWPDGVFLTEASVLEIEALATRGERSLARARAADFVSAHPDSPQAERLRALIPAKKR